MTNPVANPVARIMAGTRVAAPALVGASVVLASIVFGGAAAVAQDATQGARKPEPAKAEKIATELCAACHGPDGNSIAPINPKIASQH